MSCPASGRYRCAGVPGKAQEIITIIPAHAPDPTITSTDGITRPLHPFSLSRLVETLGGYEGDLTDPLAGQRLHVDLRAWANADPDTTRVVLGYSFYPQHPIAPEHQHLFDQWELTHDKYATVTGDALVNVYDGTAPFTLFP